MSNPRAGGKLLVDQLVIHGAEFAFCVPGESYLEVLDGLYDAREQIQLINARHEAGAANMAEAYGKLTGRPGVALVTRGPGACHASIGVHTAMQDSTPMILLVGQIERTSRDREAFQEVDFRQMFAPLAKWAAEIDDAARIPEYMARAFHLATSGRPGPVVLALPEDMLRDTASVADERPYLASQPAPSAADLARLTELLERAERPLLLVGGSRWSDTACGQLRSFAEAWSLPTTTSFRRMDLIGSDSAVYAGDFGTSPVPGLAKRLAQADLVIAIGARLGDITTQGYTTLGPGRCLVHVYPDADELARVFRPDLGIVAGPAAMAAALDGLRPQRAPAWGAWTQAARTEWLDSFAPSKCSAALDLGRGLAALRDVLPRDAIVTLDAGNHTGWPMRYLPYGRPGRLLGSTSGAMGYAVPAAVAASLVHRDRLVISFVGDGGFMMSGQEIVTAVQHGGRPIVFVVNNKSYGTIRMHQEREHPMRVIGTDLVNPDFAALGRAYGVHAEVVTRTDELVPAFERAVASGRAALIELQTDPEQITTRTTISAMRAAKR